MTTEVMETGSTHEVYKRCNYCGQRFSLTYRARLNQELPRQDRLRHDYCHRQKCQGVAGG